MKYMKYGKYIALAGLVLYILLIMMGQVSYPAAFIVLVGLVMMIINGTTKAADKAYYETIPKAVGKVKTKATIAENTAEWDKAVDYFLSQHGGMWILKTVNGMTLETKSGECIPFVAPPNFSNPYVDRRAYDAHLAKKYNCELRPHYETSYSGGSDVLHVNYNINGDISSISKDSSVEHHYIGATLLSQRALKAEKEKKRKIYMGINE